ncbi:hypothetical protein WDJ51_02270 [Rathayibacter sp. YIM 133350]|uniref:hypothetical protein n=1 Tax=Rathayibacter sp. YIM 133350 TaxID=3131992 RepID=UPI00307F5BE3
MITIPRVAILALAVVFSAYHVVLGLSSLDTPSTPWPTIVSIGLYIAATVLSLWNPRQGRMPTWIAAFVLAVSVILPLVVTAALDPAASNGYATWYVAAVGTLMTITAVRGRLVFAWTGVLFLCLQTLVWAGPEALGRLGVVGSVVWVAIAHVGVSTVARAGREAQSFAVAQREAAQWQAAQDARVNERTRRLEQTRRLAAPMLQRVVETGGELDEAQRATCRRLEAAIRDEIRGRMLLDDGVRAAVRTARERGASVLLLDEGGLDDLPEGERVRIRSRLSAAIAGTDAENIIVRSVAGDSPAAVTVVGRRVDATAAALGADDADDELALWLEIPRVDEPAAG